MGPRDRLRAADADREAVAERLRSAVTEGRLDLLEYDQRLSQTYAAKTYGELDRVLADLPGPAPIPAVSTAPATPTVYPHAARDWLAERWRPWASVVAICVAIWASIALLSGGAPYFWPVWVAIPWGLVLACRTIGGLASGEPQRWAAARGAGKPAARGHIGHRPYGRHC